MITDQDIKEIPPNPVDIGDPAFIARVTDFCDHYRNRDTFKDDFDHIEKWIRKIFWWKFTCYPAESEFIEATIRNAESKNILEIGTFTGFTTMHMVRAALPHGGKVTTVDVQKVFPEEAFERYLKSGTLKFVQGHTPEILPVLNGECFDFVFVDSDHSPEHTEIELQNLIRFTRSGTIFLFHDLPAISRPGDKAEHPLRPWIRSVVSRGILEGCILPSCFRVDAAIAWGTVNYDKRLNPHMGVFIRP